MSRKTIRVETVIDWANNYLATTDDQHSERRRGVLAMLDTILHETGNYQGFRYITNLETDHTPGVRYDENTGALLSYEERFENTDRTRVKY
tara:strand:- start:166 stop:438 length:273 start_codon:yes stop_codon:yes gene_type:complete